MTQEGVQELLQVEQLGLAIDQGHHVHAEAVLQLGQLKQLVEYHLRHFVALELDNGTHSGLVGLVSNLRDPLYLLLAHELANPHQQRGLIYLVGQLVNDDGLTTISLLDVLKVGAPAHNHAPTTGAVSVPHPIQAVNKSGRREVWCRDVLDQLLDAQIWVLQQRQAGIDHLAQVVWWDVGRHTHGDTGRPIDQQVGEAGREHQRLTLGAIVVGPEVHGLLVQVSQQLVRDARHTNFRVTHRRRVVAVDGAKVTLAVHQRVAQRERLRHTNDGVIDRRVPVRVILTDYVAHDTRRLLVGLVPVVGQLVHREKRATVHRLQAIPHVG